MNFHVFPVVVALFALGGMIDYQADTTRLTPPMTLAATAAPSPSTQGGLPQGRLLHAIGADRRAR